MITIYALCNPVTGAVRYIGKTINPVKRYNKHLHQGNPHMRNWIAKLKRMGQQPTFKIIETLEDNVSWEDRERYWIRHYQEKGCDLINCDSGGTGGKTPTKETRERLRQSHLGYQHSEATKKKLRTIVSGRQHRPETIQKLRDRAHTWGYKISASKMGHEVTDDAKEKMRQKRIAYFDRIGRKIDIVLKHFEDHPEDLSLSCRSIGRKLGLPHHHVSAAKKRLDEMNG
jgi:hypothetical protein